MPLALVHQDDEFTQVALSGQLDTQGVCDVEAEFHQMVAGRPRNAVVDLSDVEFVMSAGLNMITRAAADLKHHGAKLVLLSPRPLVRKAIHNVALDKLTPLAENLEEALRLLRE
ncbi:MAG: STAS domain-containing protein [Phycisphaerae bacterium]|nr:STAS domain-containing protein [Phycisphaerae bacterium]